MAGSTGGQAPGLVETVKPQLRGWLHLGAFPVAVICGIVLVAVADSTAARISTGIYSITAALLFGISALYHRGSWSPRAHGLLKRLDHANIFLIIAGTYTPFAVLLFADSGGALMLWIVWLGALLGVAFRVLWAGAPRWLFTPVYIALGWTAVFWFPALLRTGAIAVIVLLLVGGLIYTLGGVVYATQKPDPWPRWFGFHEVFHSFTLVAWLTHYVAVSITTYPHA